MEWFSGENVFAILAMVLGVLTSAGQVWYERRAPSSKRIGYRVQMDTAIGHDAPTGESNVRLGLFDDDPDMADATLVLLRLENDGSQPITPEDYTSPNTHGLTVRFAHRRIKAVAVTVPSDDADLMENFTRLRGFHESGDRLTVPKIHLNKGKHFKLLVLLTGGKVGDEVTVSGGISGGKVAVNRAVTLDEAPPKFSRPARLITVLLTACLIALSTIVIVRGDGHSGPMGCEKGTLTVTGSTAFAPVAEKLATAYEKDCPGSTIEVDANGSAAGVRELDTGASKAVLTLSDGEKAVGFPELEEHRVAVSVFTLVVHDDVPFKGLRTAQVKDIYSGKVKNWNQVEGPDGKRGPDLPIKLISRSDGSGTRGIFERKILLGDEERQEVHTVNDCRQKVDPAQRTFRCELDSTQQVLDTVKDVEGAIGYSELRSSTGVDGLHHLSLDEQAPSVDDIEKSDYPFREIEYGYTYGQPEPETLASSFLNYMIRTGGTDVVRAEGHMPCSKPEAVKICAEG
ncbi:PstS family phosphate ABC transporter substrate-binding protein [Streptomyces sp. NPDC058653]|uniref:PstS family phosphate ABC transporter substrate-binding protein n=1 Tax=Streptomyces sp. NPDC058653 TaxID=3346576 RepID=UPI00365E7761